MLIKNILLLSLVFFVAGSCSQSDRNRTDRQPPNILLLVADDLGYTDLGSFGGDVHTPNLDALAKSGIVFSRFHTAPLCAPTRAMLLSGNDNHIAGMGSQFLRTGVFGYEGQLTDRIIPIPALLNEAGYHTSMAGKWHLGTWMEANPHHKGFDHSFALLNGAGNHYSSKGIFSAFPTSPYTEDGEKAVWPEGSYSTNLYTEMLISYIDRYIGDDQPFFAYAAYTSPHWPLQVDPQYWKKYEEQYKDGYEVLRERRFENQKKLGLIPNDAKLPALHPRVTPWDSLTEEQQRKETREMALYAGMVDNLDYNIGRLIKYLKETGEYENTLIVFISDNGAAGEDFYNHEFFGPYLQKHYTDGYEQMGEPNSFISYGPEWAEAGASPFRYFKGYTTEGGISAPMIISGPDVRESGTVSHAFTTLMDLAPTFYELAGISYPKEFNGKQVHALKGRSLVPLLTGEDEHIHPDEYVFAFEHGGYVQVRKGDWKLVNIERPFSRDNFKLYDLSRDLAEQTDLKNEHPDILQELLIEWDKYRQEVKVQIPPPANGTGL